MNYYSKMVLKSLMKNGYSSQRQLAKDCKISLGLVNKIIKELVDSGYIDLNMQIQSAEIENLRTKKSKRAVILAAGYGMRMVPIGSEVPKALLEIKGEILIERLIRQLQEVNIQEIIIVVGYLKEMFEYLVDKYDVKLYYNKDFAIKNNLYSLSLISEKLENTYVLPSDIYAFTNPFDELEFDSWYMLGKEKSVGTGFKATRTGKVDKIKSSDMGNRVIGIAFLNQEDGKEVQVRVNELKRSHTNNQAFWEEALFVDEKMELDVKLVSEVEVVEINTYMGLREIDSESEHLNTNVLTIIAKELNCRIKDIINICVMKKGMTNRSFLFEVFHKKYIMRIPGEGTSELINRYQEAEVYKVINDLCVSDEVAFYCPNQGYKITEYWENTRECDPLNKEDVKLSMDYLRAFHDMELKVGHTFDIFSSIKYYESLWLTKSLFKDYENTKKSVFALKDFIDKNKKEYILTHVDAVPDNFLFTDEGIKLIDWEYAGMQDPHVDVAMFAIYSLYEKHQIDELIDIYFKGNCKELDRIKIYCYVAVCGLLWSNWCEYKRMVGVEFGEYSLRQYQYAKAYSRFVHNYLSEEKNEINRI